MNIKKINEEDLYSHETLDDGDLDKYYLVIRGAIFIFDEYKSAEDCMRLLTADEKAL